MDIAVPAPTKQLTTTLASRNHTRPAAVIGAAPAGPLARFVVLGVTGMLVYAAVALVMGSVVDRQSVNLLATVVSTVLVNELHRRVPFRGARRPSWLRAQSAGGGMAINGLLATSASLAVLASLAPGAGQLRSRMVVYGTQAAVGAANFLSLRRVLDWHPRPLAFA